MDRQLGQYNLSTDRTNVDVDLVHQYLSSEAYWALDRSKDTVAQSIANSGLVGGVYTVDGDQVGFARMVTDFATFGWLCDVFVLAGHQGHGLGVALVEMLVEHPDVSGLRLQILATADAHGLYGRFGYETVTEPDRWMTRRR